MKKKLHLQDVEALRNTVGRSMLLFITDRCPVGCAHCSVDSRPNSPCIKDFELFEEILQGIATQDGLQLVGISGGEPFVERRGLTAAVNRLSIAGKLIALYTSGFWAQSSLPAWIQQVIEKTSCVFLSTDQFHQAQLGADGFVRAASTIVKADAWLIVQVLNSPEEVSNAKKLLEMSFGDDWDCYAELSLIPLLPYGRAKRLFPSKNSHLGCDFGRCRVLNAPVIRYDGTLVACSNEQVVMAYGPKRLRRSVSNANDLHRELDRLVADPVLRIISDLGMKSIVAHPTFQDFASKKYTSICELCWQVQERQSTKDDSPDRMLIALSLLTREAQYAGSDQ